MDLLTKHELRRKIKEQRRQLTAEDIAGWNEAIFQKLTAHPEVLAAGCVYSYMSFGQEAGTSQILNWLWSRRKTASVPRVLDREIDFFKIGSMDDVIPGSMGILEPAYYCQKADVLSTVVIVPGLAFTPGGLRTGYGGGFYDRFFQREPEHKKIGIAYDFQIFPELAHEAFDQRVDEIITPEHHYICKEELL